MKEVFHEEQKFRQWFVWILLIGITLIPLVGLYQQLILKKRLEEYNGNRTLTAKSLGVSVRWIQLKLKEMEK